MINKKIEDITEADLQALIANNVLEGKTIEYKKELPGNTDSNKKEFLADVTSFANTSGGDLIFGIEEDNSTHEPRSLIGTEVENIDIEKTRLDNIIRTGVEPRLLNVTIKPIFLNNSKYAVLIRIPKSWISPHRVIFSGHSKFYARNSSGKYDMDIDELRIAFNLSETFIENIRNFITDRISKILSNETPVALEPYPKTVLHIITIEAFQTARIYEIDSIFENRHEKLPLLYRSVLNGRYNLDGIVTYSDRQEGDIYSSYTQLYRKGIIEAVDSRILIPRDIRGNILKIISSKLFEEKIIKSTSSYLNLLSELSIEPPVFIFLRMLNVKGYRITTGNQFAPYSQDSIERDILTLPEIMVQNYNDNIEKLLKPIFDLIWNACGEPKSLNFDEDGNWIGRR